MVCVCGGAWLSPASQGLVWWSFAASETRLEFKEQPEVEPNLNVIVSLPFADRGWFGSWKQSSRL